MITMKTKPINATAIIEAVGLIAWDCPDCGSVETVGKYIDGKVIEQPVTCPLCGKHFMMDTE